MEERLLPPLVILLIVALGMLALVAWYCRLAVKVSSLRLTTIKNLRGERHANTAALKAANQEVTELRSLAQAQSNQIVRLQAERARMLDIIAPPFHELDEESA